MLRIGLTGGIGSGKSTVAGMLAQKGAHLIDTDDIAHRLTQTGGVAVPALRAAFGPSVIDPQGALDRVQMRQLAFSDARAKQVLQDILHPLIRMQVRVQEQSAAPTAKALVFDVPLLVESGGWRERVDQVWVVDCREETQIDRVAGRPGWTRDAARAVLERQATRAQRRACADVLIFNDDQLGLQALSEQVQRLLERLCANRAAVPPDTNPDAAH